MGHADFYVRQFLKVRCWSQIHKTKTGFNQKLIALRDAKFAMLDDLQVSAAELKDIQAKLPKTGRVKLPVVPRRHPEEEPHKYERLLSTTLQQQAWWLCS